MLNRSAQYNRMMKSDLRDKTTAAIHIGAVNQQAQSGAEVLGDFWKWTNPRDVTDPDSAIEKRYLTWEEKHNRLDGSLCFLPEQDNWETSFLGAVTSEICTPEYHPSILFQFAIPHLDIKGLTIRFGESYPKAFTVETGSQSREYITDSGDFVTEDVFEDADYMRIIPGSMSNGATRLHIESILFGIELALTGKKIISMTVKEKTHPISLELPIVDFRFTLDNQDRYFNANRTDSIINYLERGQQVTAYFTQTLEDGTSETIPAVRAALDATWKDKYSTAEFSATDYIYQMDQIYESGLYRKDGISAYALLEDLFEVAGVSADEYSIDPYLKTVLIRNPLPRDTCANNMLLIANACRCVMKSDRKKKVIIKASFWPELFTTASDGTVYSQADRLLKQIDVTEYLDWQQAFNRIDGALRIPPESYSYAGFISRGISDENGYFEDNPSVTIHASAAFSFYQLSIWFGNVYPVEGTITCYKDHMLAERFEVAFSSKMEVINHAFEDVDEVRIMFTRARAHNRIHVLRLSVDEETDFTLYRSNMLEQPVTSREDKIKDLIAIRSVYGMADEQEDIFSDKLLISQDKCEFKIEFNDASIPVQIITTLPSNMDASADEAAAGDVVVDYGAEITAYSNWYCIVCFHSPPISPQEVDLKVVGYIYHISNSQYVLNVNTSGITPALTNPLIDTTEFAETYVRWCAQYYQAKAEYSLSQFMGDPVLESNDLAYFEDEDTSRKLIRVHTVETKFDGTYNGSRCEGRSMEGYE